MPLPTQAFQKFCKQFFLAYRMSSWSLFPIFKNVATSLAPEGLYHSVLNFSLQSVIRCVLITVLLDGTGASPFAQEQEQKYLSIVMFSVKIL